MIDRIIGLHIFFTDAEVAQALYYEAALRFRFGEAVSVSIITGHGRVVYGGPLRVHFAIPRSRFLLGGIDWYTYFCMF